MAARTSSQKGCLTELGKTARCVHPAVHLTTETTEMSVSRTRGRMPRRARCKTNRSHQTRASAPRSRETTQGSGRKECNKNNRQSSLTRISTSICRCECRSNSRRRMDQLSPLALSSEERDQAGPMRAFSISKMPSITPEAAVSPMPNTQACLGKNIEILAQVIDREELHVLSPPSIR